MILLIAGSSCTGKTLLAQKLMEKYKYPYLSIDHLKMGLIRSGYCALTPDSSDKDLTAYLWPVIREIIKTNIENNQNLIVEGCYIPFDYQKDFDENYLQHIKYTCLIFSGKYIHKHFDDIQQNANAIEKRLDSGSCVREVLMRDNEENLRLCKKYGHNYILIDEKYNIDFERFSHG